MRGAPGFDIGMNQTMRLSMQHGLTLFAMMRRSHNHEHLISLVIHQITLTTGSSSVNRKLTPPQSGFRVHSNNIGNPSDYTCHRFASAAVEQTLTTDSDDVRLYGIGRGINVKPKKATRICPSSGSYHPRRRFIARLLEMDGLTSDR